MPHLKPLLLFHALFGLLAAATLALAPAAGRGLVILLLVIAYNLAVPVVALRRGDDAWLRLWLFLLPLSVLQVLPDWLLSAGYRVLVFPDLGVPRLGSVPLYMAGMWVIPLTLILAMASSPRSPARRASAAAALALLVFGLAEFCARPLALWHAQDVRQFLGVALYVLPAETLLGAAAMLAFEITRWRGIAARLLGAAAVTLLYIGALALGLFLIG